MSIQVTPERYASGMTFDEYVAYVGTPENLARESSGGPSQPRQNQSAFLKNAYEQRQLNPHQRSALKWLVDQPGGPARMLVISEEWSSDCRRDVPTFARIAAETGMELRIFRRDGQKFSDRHAPTLTEAPDSNADLMAQFLNQKNGDTWQSIPVCAFFTRDLEYLYHYQEYPAIYEKDRIVAEMRKPKSGESPEQAQARFGREFPALHASDLFQVWACAAVDEIISSLHRRLLLGTV
jgi:thiol-disulfide isomerase/thioredoxin